MREWRDANELELKGFVFYCRQGFAIHDKLRLTEVNGLVRFFHPHDHIKNRLLPTDVEQVTKVRETIRRPLVEIMDMGTTELTLILKDAMIIYSALR